MPLYDCMLLLKPHIPKEAVMDLIFRVGKHVQQRNDILTDIKSFGHVQLGYGIKKLDGRYFQGQMAQVTMMATPNINKELHYLNKEDRLLRWLLVKNRGTKYGLDFLGEEDGRNELSKFPKSAYMMMRTRTQTLTMTTTKNMMWSTRREKKTESNWMLWFMLNL